MKVTYTVHNPHRTPSATRAVVNGKEMTATVDALEIELVAQDSTHGGIKLRFIGDDIAGAEELFKPDAKITATFAAEGAAPEGGAAPQP